MSLPLTLLTLCLHAAPPPPSPYASARFEKETSTQTLSVRYEQHPGKTPDEPEWEERADFVPLQKQIREGKIAAPLSDADKALVRELDAISQSPKPPAGSWYALPARSTTHAAENLQVPSYLDTLLHVGDKKLTATSRENAEAPKRGAFRDAPKSFVSNLMLLEGSPSDVRKVYFKTTQLRSARTMSRESLHAIALFEGGKLQRVVTLETFGIDLGSGEDERFPPQRVTASVLVPGYSEGKVSRLELTQLEDEHGAPQLDPETGITLERTVYLVTPRS